MILTGEESNYYVLKQVVDCIKNGIPVDQFLPAVEEFISSKQQIEDNLSELRRKARSGCTESAKLLISELARMKDGP